MERELRTLGQGAEEDQEQRRQIQVMAADPLAGGQDRVEVVAADDMAEQQEPEQEAQPAATGDRQHHSRAVAGPYGVVPVSDEQEGEQAGQLQEESQLNQVARQPKIRRTKL